MGWQRHPVPRNRHTFSEQELRTLQGYGEQEGKPFDGTTLLASDVAHAALELLDEARRYNAGLSAALNAQTEKLVEERRAALGVKTRYMELLNAAEDVTKSAEHYFYVVEPKPLPDWDEYDEMMSPLWTRLHELVNPKNPKEA